VLQSINNLLEKTILKIQEKIKKIHLMMLRVKEEEEHEDKWL
jgi:hypothetical protein